MKINRIFQGDRVIWVIVIMLALVSLMTVYSATGTYANVKYDGNNAFALLRHAVTLVLGLCAVFAAHRLKYTYYSKLFKIAFWVSIPLLLYILRSGADINGAQRVVYVFGKVSFQPSDFAKVALVGYLASELTKRQEEIKSFKSAFVPLMLPVLVIVGLIFPENFSTAGILFASCMVLLFVGRINMKYLLGFFAVVVFIMSIYVVIVLNVAKDKGRTGVWVTRIERFADKFIGEEKSEEEMARAADAEDFQEIQSKIAIAGGGLLGKAPGKSTQRNYLPHPYSDFIFAIIVEEYGLLGGVFVILLYLILLYRAIRIMVLKPQTFGGFLAFGLAFMMVMQAMVNVGVATGIFPVTGQPLPMVSMGGTSLLFTGFAFGVILSVSKELDKKQDERQDELATTEDNEDNN